MILRSKRKIDQFFRVLFCFMVLFSGIIFADVEINIESALSAVKNEEYDKAFSQFQLLANKGEAEAQHNLAMMYRLGKGTKKNIGQSLGWFRKAADQGVVDAQYYLGHAYDVGEGVTPDKKFALVWYRKAAEKGHGLAQINLGVLYANGLGTVQDVEQAYLWFHVAAAQGYKAAFENKEIVEEVLAPETIEELKKKGRDFYKLYVMPYQRHSLSYPRMR